jgi:uncharacterized protein YuzE
LLPCYVALTQGYRSIQHVVIRIKNTLKITYDSEVDALYIRFLETTVTAHHVAEGISVDYDAEGKIAGIEILDAVKRFGSKDVFKKVTLEDLTLQAK